MQDYWIKQSDKPAFPDLLWSRPENRMHAGKLLIISGNAAGFAVAAQAFAAATKAGAGTVRVVLPEFLRGNMPKEVQFEIDFAPGVTHGSFGKKALVDLLAHAQWADAVLLPGGVGRNSETSALLEQFVQKYRGLLIAAEDAVDVFIEVPQLLFDREQTVIVADFSQLQKMWGKLRYVPAPIRFGMPLSNLVEAAHVATKDATAAVITSHQAVMVVAAAGQVSSTPNPEAIWRVEAAGKAGVWAMQHPSQLFQALTVAVASHSSE